MPDEPQESPDTETPESTIVAADALDANATQMLTRLQAELGDAIIEHGATYGDVVVRVRLDAWKRTAEFCKSELGCDYLSFIAGIDWMPTPAVTEEGSGDTSTPAQPKEQTYGVAGSEGRYQLLAVVESTRRKSWRIVLKTDVGDDLMAEIRVEIKAMIENRSAAVEQRRESIVQSLKSARGGIALTSVIALLAFYQTLRQTRALAAANQRRKEELESERDQLDGLVKQRTARLAELATYLQRVREDERAHLARELHDELGSLLTAAKLDVARLKSKIAGLSPEVQDRLKHLTESLNAGIALKRRIIEDLRPSSLANLGLAASLDILAREFSTRADLEVTTEIEEVQLDASAQLTAYRLVQESLTNIGKYAHAKKVQVRVRALPAEVLVEVRDDGKGFHPELVQPDAHGLAGMRHRVESAGGTLEVTSSAGSGTRIAGRLPKSGVMRQPASPDSMQINDTALANRG